MAGVTSRLIAARRVAADAMDPVFREIHSRISKVVDAVTGCERKVHAAIEAALSPVRKTVDRTKSQVELDAILALTAAREVARTAGCDWPSDEEIMAKRPRWPVSESPMSPVPFVPTVTTVPFTSARVPATRTPAVGGSAAGALGINPPEGACGGEPGSYPPPCEEWPCGRWEDGICCPPNGATWSWGPYEFDDVIFGAPAHCTANCRSNVDGGSGQPTVSCETPWGSVPYSNKRVEGCIAGCGPTDPGPIPPPPPPVPTPGPGPGPIPTPQPQPVPSPGPGCHTECDLETQTPITCCPDGEGGEECHPGEPGTCFAPAPCKCEKCCPPPKVEVEAELKRGPIDCSREPDRSSDVCFKPPDPPERTRPPNPTGVVWGQPDDCDRIDAAFESVGKLWKIIANSVLAGGIISGDATPEEVAATVSQRVPPWWGWLVQLALPPAVAAIQQGVKSFAEMRGCRSPNLAAPQMVMTFWEIVGKWVGFDPSDSLRWLKYAIDSECPTRLPTVSELHNAYLRGEISRKEWECWVQANNEILRPAEQMMRSGRAKPNIADVISLYRRDYYNFDQFSLSMRNNGVLDSLDAKAFYELSKLIPPYSDLVRMMVRDSFDDGVAQRFGYDQDFEVKFSGKAVEWAHAQGVEKDVMKYLWRAHWRLPSPTQAFEMLHRNRPGRVPENLVVRRADVIALLQIDDLAPWWQERLTSISYRVMRLVDIRKQYNFGVYGDAELTEQLQDRGYNLENSRIQTRAMARERFEWLVARPDSKAYVQGHVTRAEVTASLQQYRPPADVLAGVLTRLDFLRAANQRKKCFAATKKRYLHGEIDAPLAITVLVGMGYEPAEAVQWVSTWTCELQTRSKEVTAQTMCGWLEKGLITRAEMRLRLVRIGYTHIDAQRIILHCLMGIFERRRAAYKKLQDLKDKAREKVDKEKNRMFRDGEKREKDKAKAWKGVGDDSEQAKLILVKAARRWAKYTEGKWKPVLDELENYLCELRAKKGYSMLGAARLLTELVVGTIEEGGRELRTGYLDLRSTLEDSPQTDMDCAHFIEEGLIPPLPPKPLSNGQGNANMN